MKCNSSSPEVTYIYMLHIFVISETLFIGPEPVMKCTDGRISASFSTITDPHLNAKHLSVNTTYTGPCNERITNSTDFITISVPFDECGTNASVGN